MITAAGLATSVLLLNAPAGGVMMLSGLLLSLVTLTVVCRHVSQGGRLPGGRWFAQLYALHLTVIGACSASSDPSAPADTDASCTGHADRAGGPGNRW
ncbi:MAG: hypothetical protein RR184_01470 [Citrobacter sp.]|uniref:hypothetical protein n=1 Tax=Citrobacter sp. TaxID=1896336 RepID=UPI002FC9161A